MSDDESALWDGALTNDRLRRKLAEIGRAGVDGSGFQHTVAPPEDPHREHPLSRLAGPLHLFFDSTGIKVEVEGEWHARKHDGSNRRVWRKSHLGIHERTLEFRAVEMTGNYIGDAPVLPDLLCQILSDEEIGSVTGDRTAPTTRASATMPSVIEALRPSPHPPECQTMETYHGGRHRAQRWSVGIKTPGPRNLAKLERMPSSKSCRDKSALHETVGATPHGTGFRSLSCRGPSRHRHHEWLYLAWHARHENCGMNVSGETGGPFSDAFVQQSRSP